MFWQSICIDRVLHKHELLKVLSDLFGVQQSEILIVKEIPETPLDETIRIMCQTYLNKNSTFLLMIEIYLRDPSLIPQNDTAQLSKFCNMLQCRGIVGDESSINPYAWLLLESDSSVKKISVDNIEEYDEAETYEIN